MESLGKYLKAERESRNLSLKEVFESTRIKERLLQAIEEDRYDLLSSPIYAKGFLDAYARYLGLDPNEILLWYQKNQENGSFSTQPQSKQRNRSLNLTQRVTTRKKKVALYLLLISISVMILFLAAFIWWKR